MLLLVLAYGIVLGYLFRPQVEAFFARLERAEKALFKVERSAELKAA